MSRKLASGYQPKRGAISRENSVGNLRPKTGNLQLANASLDDIKVTEIDGDAEEKNQDIKVDTDKP